MHRSNGHKAVKVNKYNSRVNHISTAIVEEGFTLLKHNAEDRSKHLVFECEDNDGYRFKLTYSHTPRGSGDELPKVLRSYARRGYKKTLHFKTKVKVAVEGTVKSCKTQDQLMFEEQCGKIQKQYTQQLLEEMKHKA